MRCSEITWEMWAWLLFKRNFFLPSSLSFSYVSVHYELDATLGTDDKKREFWLPRAVEYSPLSSKCDPWGGHPHWQRPGAGEGRRIHVPSPTSWLRVCTCRRIPNWPVCTSESNRHHWRFPRPDVCCLGQAGQSQAAIWICCCCCCLLTFYCLWPGSDFFTFLNGYNLSGYMTPYLYFKSLHFASWTANSINSLLPGFLSKSLPTPVLEFGCI